MENPKETLPAAKEQIPKDRLKQRIRQLIRDEKVLENEVTEYIKVSDCDSLLDRHPMI